MKKMEWLFRRPALVIATLALFVALGGGAYAATGQINGSQLKNGTVQSWKLTHLAWRQLRGQTGPAGARGPAGAVGATGAQGPRGDSGPQGPAGTPILFESTQECSPDLCLDAAPDPAGDAGSSGWGWDNQSNGPVTSLSVGSTNTLTVTVLQPNAESADGSVTVNFDPYDFTLKSTPDDGDCTTTSVEVSCSFTDLAHDSKSIPFSFQTQHADPDAVIGVQADVNGEVATQQIPVAITQ